MPKKTVVQIKQSGNEYCIQVKGNQPKLKAQIEKNISNNEPLDSYSQQEKNRGRLENRVVKIYDDLSGISEEWIGLQRLVSIHRFGHRPDKKENNGWYDEQSYYILSAPIDDAKVVFEGIRGHWGIENRLHYVKDVVQNEDNSKIKVGKAIENLSILKNATINLFRMNGFDSITKANIRFANKIHKMMELIKSYDILKKYRTD